MKTDSEFYCSCPKITCPYHGDCGKCVKKHKENDSLTFCMFPDNDGDKSNYSYYKKLEKRFEK